MERNITASKAEIDSQVSPTTQSSAKCSTCGEEFETPLLAKISSGSRVEEYYACPKCLTKAAIDEHQKNVEIDETEEKEEILKIEDEDTKEETVACNHHFGYLKRRPKNTPIPEDCFTCIKMIDCMSK